jgi:signal transduction histidine kinase
MAQQSSYEQLARTMLVDRLTTQAMLATPDALQQVHELRVQALMQQLELEALRQERDRLQQQMNQQQTLHAGMFSLIAHEFRTPLASIETTTDTLQRYADQFSLQDQLQRLGRIQTIVQHLHTLLDDMGYLSRLQSGDLLIQAEAIEVDLFCQEMISEAEQQQQVADRISLTLSGSEPVICFDAALLRRILINLLSNALKYTPPTGQIRLEVHAGRDQVTLIVQDDGIGIPQEDQAQIFGLFQRGSNVEHIKGTGLGLAIVRQTVERCHGSITFSSALNVGTTFELKLPLQIP